MRLTDDWFNRNIAYGQRDWYCTNNKMYKDITTDIHGPWHERPFRDSISVHATSTTIPNTVKMPPTSLQTKKRCASTRRQMNNTTSIMYEKLNDT